MLLQLCDGQSKDLVYRGFKISHASMRGILIPQHPEHAQSLFSGAGAWVFLVRSCEITDSGIGTQLGLRHKWIWHHPAVGQHAW